MSAKYQLNDVRACRMIDTARCVFQKDREERMRVTRALAGNRYSPNAHLKKIYVNLLGLYKRIVRRNLISQNPRAMLSTYDIQQTAAVTAAEGWINQELVRQNFASNMGRIVDDGLIGPMGICMVALATPGDAAMLNWGVEAGSPLMYRIDLDDFVCSWRSRDFDELDFIGYRSRLPLEVAKNNPRWHKKSRENLMAMEQMAYNKEGDERIGQIWREDDYDDDLEDMCEVWNIYYPRHKTIKVYPDQCVTGPSNAYETKNAYCLYEGAWIGHPRGPFPLLAYDNVPGNLMPKGPMADLVDLAEGYNETYRKLMRQAARLKVNTVYRRDNPEDGEAMRKANDGDCVGIEDPQSFKEVSQGGTDAGLYQWSREMIERFMEQAGNLATMGGLASQAGTLGQEELLQQQSNGQIAFMQDVTLAFVSDVCDRMLWYYWHDPRLIMQSKVNDPNIPDVNYVSHVYPGENASDDIKQHIGDRNVMRRMGNKPNIKIDPYSMRHTTPQQRAKDLMSIVTQIYVPLAQVAQQQGVVFDFQAFLGIMGGYMDAPDVQRILSIQAPPQTGDSLSTGSGGPTKPAETTRNYNRRSTANSPAAQKGETNNRIAAAMAGASGGNGKMEGSNGY